MVLRQFSATVIHVLFLQTNHKFNVKYYTDFPRLVTFVEITKIIVSEITNVVFVVVVVVENYCQSSGFGCVPGRRMASKTSQHTDERKSPRRE